MKSKRKRYIEPEDFADEYQKSLNQGEPTARLMHMFELIGTHLQPTFGFSNKKDQDACINYAVMEAWKKWRRYDENRSNNLFAFFTSMISNDMKTHYNKLTNKKYRGVTISIDVLINAERKQR